MRVPTSKRIIFNTQSSGVGSASRMRTVYCIAYCALAQPFNTMLIASDFSLAGPVCVFLLTGPFRNFSLELGVSPNLVFARNVDKLI